MTHTELGHCAKNVSRLFQNSIGFLNGEAISLRMGLPLLHAASHQRTLLY